LGVLAPTRPTLLAHGAAVTLLSVSAIWLPPASVRPPQELGLWSIPSVGLIFDPGLTALIAATAARLIELLSWSTLEFTPTLLTRIPVRRRGLTLRSTRLTGVPTKAFRLAGGFQFTGLLKRFSRVFVSWSPELLLLRHVLLVVGLGRCKNAQIVLSVLVVAFRHHYVARGMGIAGELHVFFGNRLRRAADLHIGSVAFVDAVDGIAAPASSPAWTAASSAATRSFVVVVIVLALSHDLLSLAYVAIVCP
jgi:hypothetical protein